MIDPAVPFHLMPFATEDRIRRIEPPIRIGRSEISRYTVAVVTEWMDPETGEIIPDAVAQGLPGYPRRSYRGEQRLRREFVLSRLRPEPRAFAVFLLQFRNQRRGLTPGVSELCRWYAKLTGRRSDHVRRLLAPLEAARILVPADAVDPLWQLATATLGASTVAGEYAAASAKFQTMLNIATSARLYPVDAPRIPLAA